MQQEVDSDTNCNWWTRNDPHRLGERAQELEIGGPAEYIQTTILLRSAIVLRRVLEILWYFLSLRLANNNNNNQLMQVWKTSSSSSSSCRAASRDIPDPLSPLLRIVHRLWQVFRATSRILSELLNVCSSWSSCFCLAIRGGPLEYVTYELVPASPAVSCMCGSFNLDTFRDRRQVAVYLVPCGVLPPGFVQYCSQQRDSVKNLNE